MKLKNMSGDGATALRTAGMPASAVLPPGARPACQTNLPAGRPPLNHAALILRQILKQNVDKCGKMRLDSAYFRIFQANRAVQFFYKSKNDRDGSAGNRARLSLPISGCHLAG
jgi:hypothetical protein